MSSSKKTAFFDHLLPSPFAIAVILTFFSVFLAILVKQDYSVTGIITIAGYWEKGFWELLKFTMQMALILILGHALAVTSLFNSLFEKVVQYCTNTAWSAMLVGAISIALSFFNWGLCLIAGAILARKVGEHAVKHQIKINYPLVAASGYAGLMTWHGGLSGSAPLTVTQQDHFLVDSIGVIPIVQTTLSVHNLMLFAALLMVLPVLLFWKGHRTKALAIPDLPIDTSVKSESQKMYGAEKLDFSPYLSKIFGLFLFGLFLLKSYENHQNNIPLLTLDNINLLFFALGIFLHQNFSSFLKAVENGVKGASGIIIQFPLYAGIMGIIKYSGLGLEISSFFISISNAYTFNFFTFLSAGLLNILVPSGGGQWAIQGEIVCNAANTLNLPVDNAIMALAYGDQLTNMLQPFWALPLLGITKLKGRQIYQYSSWLFLVGFIIFGLYLIVV